jgi:hypothetical protein
MYHPNPEINRQRQRDMQDWMRERRRDGGGCSLPPCGCLLFIVTLVFGCIVCGSSGGVVSTHCTPEMGVVECTKAIVRSIDLPF